MVEVLDDVVGMVQARLQVGTVVRILADIRYVAMALVNIRDTVQAGERVGAVAEDLGNIQDTGSDQAHF